MNQPLKDTPHRLGVGFANVIVFAGIGYAAFDLSRGGKPTDVLAIAGGSIVLAVLCYGIVRLVGWGHAELMAVTREHRAPRA